MTDQNQSHKNQQTWFGFRQVASSDKEKLVGDVFSSVAHNYDIMNDAMSFGVHRLWKDQMIRELAPEANSHLLDMAGGTGDIAFRYLKKLKSGHVTVSDINQDMLDEGKKRAIDNNIIKGIEFKQANAEKLPFKDNSFDYYTIAFGIRNVTNIDKALSEAYRVLKPGGKFVCMEFSKVENHLISKLYKFYSFNVIPQMGKFIAKDKESYQYLVESIAKFPHQEKFKKMIETAGFENTYYKNLSFGVVAIHVGYKI